MNRTAIYSFLFSLLFAVAFSASEVRIKVHQGTFPESYSEYNVSQTSPGNLILTYDPSLLRSAEIPRVYRAPLFSRDMTTSTQLYASSQYLTGGVNHLQFDLKYNCESYSNSYPYAWQMTSYEKLCTYIIWVYNPTGPDHYIPFEIRFSQYSTSFDIIMPGAFQNGIFYTDAYKRQTQAFSSMFRTSDLCASYSYSSAYNVDDLQIYCQATYPTTMLAKYLIWSCGGAPTVQIMARNFLLNLGSCEKYLQVPTSVIGYYQTSSCKATLILGDSTDVNLAVVVYDGSKDKPLTRTRTVYTNTYQYESHRSDDSWIAWVAIVGFCCCLFVCAGIIHNRNKQQSTVQAQVTPLVQMEEVTPQVQLHQSTFGAQQYQQQPGMGMPVNHGYGYGSQYKL